MCCCVVVCRVLKTPRKEKTIIPCILHTLVLKHSRRYMPQFRFKMAQVSSQPDRKHRGSSFWFGSSWKMQFFCMLLRNLMVFAAIYLLLTRVGTYEKAPSSSTQAKMKNSLSPLLWWCSDNDDVSFKINEQKQQRPLKIACVGDSLTRGDGSHEVGQLRPQQLTKLKDRGNFPKMLHSLLAGRGREDGMSPLSSIFDVRNFGLSGSTACHSSDRPYIESPEFQNVLKFEPDIIVIMFGTNDAKIHNRLEQKGGSCGEKDKKVLLGMEEILLAINKAKTKEKLLSSSPSIPVVLILPPPVLEEKFGILPSLIPSVRDEIRLIGPPASKKQADSCRRIDPKSRVSAMISGENLIPPNPAYFAPDGIHLNQMGSRLIACAVFRQLLEQFRCAGCNYGDDEHSALFEAWKGSLRQCPIAMK